MASIIKISEAATLGLHAMIVLAKNPKKMLSTGEISKKLGSSVGHLAKVMQRLSKIGLVNSVRGPKGGFCLGKDAHSINLLEIYEAIEGPITSVECLLQFPVCKNKKCVFGDLIRTINGEVLTHMANTMLSTQIEAEENQDEQT
jgi:Rrf2 family protein